MQKGKKFEEVFPHLTEFKAYLDLLNKESDRGAVLISATMIEDLLGKSILAFLVEYKEVERLLEGFNAPLGTFSSRSLCALALGVLSEEEYQECERVRKIRNEFAHRIRSHFDDQKIKGLCANLLYSTKDYGGDKMNGKEQFLTAAVSMIVRLTNRPHYASQKRLKIEEWGI